MFETWEIIGLGVCGVLTFLLVLATIHDELKKKKKKKPQDHYFAERKKR